MLAAAAALGTLTVALLFGLLGIALGRIRRLRSRIEDLESAVKRLADRD
jgi:hypothetical protein